MANIEAHKKLTAIIKTNNRRKKNVKNAIYAYKVI